MRSRILMLLVIAVGVYACRNNNGQDTGDREQSQNAVIQQQDGTISLEVDEADTYHDTENPESNTAEWSVMVSKTGRYDVWLSSATKDTTDLQYNNSVLLSIHDNRIEALPVADRVIENPTDGPYPYRADSFIGSLFIPDTGMVDIQVISDKILPSDKNEDSSSEATKLLSVVLTPVN